MTEVSLETQDPISVDLESDIPTIDVEIDTSEYNFIIEMQASGPPGKEGKEGPPGPPGDFTVEELLTKTTFIFEQSKSSREWLIEHHLGFRPSVNISTYAGTIILGAITYIDKDSLKVNFSTEIAGYAYLS